MKKEKNGRKSIMAIFFVTMMIASVLAVVPSTLAQAPLKVVCVPYIAPDGTIQPHPSWDGNEVTLKGTVKGGTSPYTYEWNPGDGSASYSGSVGDPYCIGVKHTYSGNEGDTFTATLTVTDNAGDTDSCTYEVIILNQMLETEVNFAIDEGLWCLHCTQNRFSCDGADCGSWSDSGYTASPTAVAVNAFENQGHLSTGDLDEDPYVETTDRGLNYIFTQCSVVGIGMQTYGDPDYNVNGIGVGISSGRPLYEIGMVIMAIVASGAPGRIATTGPANVVGRTYKDILEDMADYCAWAQNEAGNGRGGWRYSPNYGSSDNSVTQWPILGLAAAETWGIKRDGPAPLLDVKSELELWLSYSQNFPKPPGDGGFGYSGPGGSNPVRTAAGLCGLYYIGVPEDNPRVEAAFQYICEHWQTSCSSGMWDNYYAMYGVAKAAFAYPEADICGHDWYAEEWVGGVAGGMAPYLVEKQQDDGCWPVACAYTGRIFDTGWAILILSKKPWIVEDPWGEINKELDELIEKVNAADMPNIIKRRLIGKLEYAKVLKDNAKIECEEGNFDYATKKLGVAKNQMESFERMVKRTRRISPADKASFLTESAKIIEKIDELVRYIETEHRCF